ncbi:MAG: hypothetical protein ACE5GQ_03195, partial [Nitrospinales bacterium]
MAENQKAGKWNGIWDFGHGPLVAPKADTDGCVPVGDSYTSNTTCRGQRGVTIRANNGVPHHGFITYPLHTGLLRTLKPGGGFDESIVYFVLSDTDDGGFAKEFGVTLVANNLKMTKAGALEFQAGET